MLGNSKDTGSENKVNMASKESATQTQEKEIADLKTKFTTCKVIKDVGDFTHVVDVKYDNVGLTIKFQLEKTYPATIPNVIVKSSHLNGDNMLLLTQHLQVKAEELLGENMMEKLYNLAKDWMLENGLQTTPDEIQTDHIKSVKKGKKSGKSKNISNDDKPRNKKLASMKTATDVVSRIIWDEQLPMEHFAVGYLDRFVGIVERAFSTFTWEDLASVDYDALAIPKHRIHYFKYKGLKVWDKDERLDNVFGSTGSGLTITEVIEKYEAGEMSQDEALSKNNPNICREAESDSDEEDIVIKTGLEEANAEDGIVYARDKYWGPKKRPTHFICLRVTDQAIIEAVTQVKSKILEVEPSYEENIMPPERLHITLSCVGLDTYEDIDKATQLLHKIKPELDALNPQNIGVELSGVDNFFHNVLYAKVKHNADFLVFVRTLTLALQEASIEIRDVFEFSPHMTLLKFKKSLQKEMKTRYLEPRLYEKLENTNFGVQNVNNIYLCQMSEDRDEAGFYITPTHLKF